MTSGHQVVVITVDDQCNYWKETLSANDALLKLLRFIRKHPQAACTIELRLRGGKQDELPLRRENAAQDDGLGVALSEIDTPLAELEAQPLIEPRSIDKDVGVVNGQANVIS